MNYINDNNTYPPTNVWDINNVIQIAFLSYNNKVIIIDPRIFNSIISNTNINDGKDVIPTSRGDNHDPVSGYEIKQDKLGQIHSELNTSDAAWHRNSTSSLIDFNGENTTEFFKLFNIDITSLKNRKFNQFNSSGLLEKTPKRWLYIDKNDTPYTVYYRIFYRTLDDYLTYINCNSNNLKLDSYQNNNYCKNYINDNNKNEWIANTCVRESISENNLFGICNNQLVSNDVNNITKKNIIKKQAEFCKKDINLINNPNCRKFWGVGNASFNDYYTKSDKSDFFEANNWIRNTLCKDGHNNYPFCNCINNEKNKVSYKDSSGKTHFISSLCLTDYCTDQAYQPTNYEEAKCPDICIQNVEGNYANIKGVTQTCAINKTEQSNQTTILEPSNNMTLEEDENSSANKENNINSLFNYQNETIKNIMNNFGINFPIKSNNYDIIQEDLFLLIILFIIFIFIIRSLFKQKDEPYQYYQQPYYAQQYYGPQYYPQ